MNSQPPQPADDEDLDPEEIQSAADETPTDVTAPELSEGTKDLTEWDEAPESLGVATHKVLPDDEEVTIAEQLVDEGTDEADRQTRIAAADPDFEP